MKRPTWLTYVKIAAIVSLLINLGCSLDKPKTENGRSIAAESTGDGSEQTSQTGEKTTKEESTVSSNQETTSTTLNLAVIDPAPKILTPALLTRSTAQIFNLGQEWKAIRDCSDLSHNMETQCKNGTGNQKKFCVKALPILNQLYCSMGGEAKQQAAYLGHKESHGDIINLWQAALDICSLRTPDVEPSGETPSILNFVASDIANHSPLLYATSEEAVEQISKRMVARYLNMSNSEAEASGEIEFLMSDIFGDADISNDADVFTKHYAAACAYLITYPSRLAY